MTILLLIIAAILEVGGDALIRSGLKGKGLALIALGIIVLGVYGLMVNLTKLDFGHLMGIYIVLFFVVSQLIAIGWFKEPLRPSTAIGGVLVIAGGCLMFWWPK